ncbi:MAG: right-handed parallel beta-helix repeat-containing protein [Mogibacterium sp.]|nr:right-handed parallel beta-helix repeat-containing protein [Mogibacterium sp.]
MKKYIALLSAFLIILCCMSPDVYAADAAGSDNAVTVSSIEELQKVLTLENPGTIRFDSSVSDPIASGRVTITANNATIDLGGRTFNSSEKYLFDIQGSNVSLINGTINNGGVQVTGDDSTGEIKGLTINNAPVYGIYVFKTGKIGNITGNTINSSDNVSINVQSGYVSGAISGNTINGCKSGTTGALYLYGGAVVGGGITDNTISNASGMGIRLFSASRCGDIRSNVISGAGDSAIKLDGDKSSSSNDGCSAGDIISNRITNCKGSGIAVYNGSGCGRISGNYLENIGGAHNDKGDYGITVNSGCKHKSFAAEITNNEIINVTSAGIVVFSGPDGKVSHDWQDNGYIQGDIAFNTVKNAPSLKIANRTRASIYVDNHARVYGDIHDNIVENSVYDGISVISYSSVHSIYRNSVTGAKICGIAVKDSSSVSGDIFENTVSGAKEQGVMVNNNSVVKGIVYGNTILNPGINGIFVTNGAKANIIRGNTISKAGTYGVIAGNKGKINQVISNTITVNNAKAGMGIICNSPKCLIAKISGNKISGKYHTGIRIKSPTGKVTIKANVLKTSSPKGRRSTGISCEKAKKITVTGNKITGNKTAPGILLIKCKGTVKSNTIKKCSTKIAKK